MRAGYSQTEASSINQTLKKRHAIQKPGLRSDSFESALMQPRKEDIGRFLDDDRITIVSDRREDQRLVGNERVSHRFLRFSVRITHLKLIDFTGIRIGETTFRKILKSFPQIKTRERKHMTAVCRCKDSKSVFIKKFQLIILKLFLNPIPKMRPT